MRLLKTLTSVERCRDDVAPVMQRAASEPIELLVDTHVHTHYSDGLAGVPRIERFCRDRKYGVAITDHNEIRGSVSMYERQRAPVIPAIEVGTAEGIDLLVYFRTGDQLEEFYRRAVEPYRRSRFMVRSWIQTVDCLRAVKELDAYVSLAHPFALGRKSLDYQHGRQGQSFVDSLMNEVDAIELHNGGVHRKANLRAKLYAETAGKRLTVGSDSHRLGTIGSSGTYLRAAGESPADLFESLRATEDLQFKLRNSVSATAIPLLGIIALKHTRHFMRAEAWGRS